MRLRHLYISLLAGLLCVNLSAQELSAVSPSGPILRRPRIHAAPRRPHLERELNMAPRGLLILAEFTDIGFDERNTRLAFDSLANGEDYTYGGATGSCKRYFADQSAGVYDPVFDVVGPVILPHSRAWYGTNKAPRDDRYIADFVMDACAAAQEKGIDFSHYDHNNDTVIDFVYIIYAGRSEADGGGATCIWPHNWDIESALAYGNTNQTTYYCDYDWDRDTVNSENLPYYDGKRLNTYACSNELQSGERRNGIGTICHEFGHVLGLPDYYVTDEDAPMSGENMTCGNWSVMEHGNYLNHSNTPPNYSAYDKYFLGWTTPTVAQNGQTYTLPADGQTYLMVTRDGRIPAEGPYTPDTVYYVENRQKQGWDAYLPGHGMLVWQVVYDEKQWDDNTPNDNTTRYLLFTASGTAPGIGGTRQDIPFPGSTGTTSLTLFRDCRLWDITEAADGTITLKCSSTASGVETEMGGETEKLYRSGLADGQSATCYDVLGRPVSPASYRGLIITRGNKYLFP